MWEIGELCSGSAIPLPPPHPVQKSKTARALSGKRSIAAPAQTVAEARVALPLPTVRVDPVQALRSTHKFLHRPQKLVTGKRLGNVSIRSLLLCPESFALHAFGTDHHHRNAAVLFVALQFAASLEAVPL